MARSTRRRNNTRKIKGNLGGNRTSLKTFRNGSSAPSKSASRHIHFRGNSRHQTAMEKKRELELKVLVRSFSGNSKARSKPISSKPLSLGHLVPNPSTV